MFIRSEVKSRNTITVSSKKRVSDQNMLLDKLQSRVKEQIDYKTPNPFSLIYQATKPIVIALTAEMPLVC